VAARQNDAMKQYLRDAIKAADQGLRAVDLNAGGDLDQLLAKYDHPESPVRQRPALPNSPNAAQKKELTELEQFLSRQTASLDRMSALPLMTPKTAALDDEIDSVLEQVMHMEMADKKEMAKKAAPAGGAYMNSSRGGNEKTSKKKKKKSAGGRARTR
jgi:hypothetical protein